jgi:HEAT repeat protein
LRTAQSEDETYVAKSAARAIEKIESSSRASIPSPARRAPTSEVSERRKEIEADIGALSKSGSRRTKAALRLLERAPDSLPFIHRAVLSPETPTRDLGRLIGLMLDLGDPRSVDVLLRLVATEPKHAGLRIDVLRALGELPQTAASFELAATTFDDETQIPRVRLQALMYFAMQRDLRGRERAQRHMDDLDLDMRATALYLLASLGDAAALDPITAMFLGRPGASLRFTLLLALAELVDPIEFARRAGSAPQDDEYDSAMRITTLRSAPPRERVRLAREMLASKFPNERRIAMRAILGAEGLAEITPLLSEWWKVPPPVRASVAAEIYRAGYRIVEKERHLVLEKRPPS